MSVLHKSRKQRQEKGVDVQISSGDGSPKLDHYDGVLYFLDETPRDFPVELASYIQQTNRLNLKLPMRI